MKQLFGYSQNAYYAFLPSRVSGCVKDIDKAKNNQGVIMTYYGGERKACADILLTEQIFESSFNDDRVEDMKKYLSDRKVTGLETINPYWEICVDYTIYDNTGRITTAGVSRMDALTSDVQITRSSASSDNELIYTYGKEAKATMCIPVGNQASYGLKRVESIYPLQLVINRIYVEGNTYADELMGKMNRMRAARFGPSPHRRHSGLITDPRYYYDRYPHQCQPIPLDPPPCAPNFPGTEGGTTYDSRFPIDEYGRPTEFPPAPVLDRFGRPLCPPKAPLMPPMPDYVPGPIPYIDHYSPVPNPHHPCHPMHIPYPKFSNGIDYYPVFRYMSIPARKMLEEKYRSCSHYQAPRVTIYSIDGSSLKYNGMFREEVREIFMDITVILDNFVMVNDDSEIIKIIEENAPSSGLTCDCDCCELTRHYPPKRIYDVCDCCCEWAYYTGLIYQDKENQKYPYDDVNYTVTEWFTKSNKSKNAPIAKFTNKTGICTVSGNFGNPIIMWNKKLGDIEDIKDKNSESVLSKFITTTVTINGIEYKVYILNGESGGVDATSEPLVYTLVWKE